MSHASNCILRRPCVNAYTPSCSPLCGYFIGIHGTNGSGGRIANANVPKEYRNLTLLTSPCRDDQADAYERIKRYTKTFSRQFEPSDTPSKRIKSLYLFSESPGTGKTTTASAILNEWLIVHYIGSLQRDRQPLERPAYFCDINALQTLFNRVHMSVGDDAKKRVSDEFQRMIDIAMTTPFVVFDDVGIREATSAFRAYIHDIINARVAGALPSVYTSNVSLYELESVFDARLADRIRDQTVEINFVGASKRGMRL